MVGHKLGEFSPTRQFSGHTPADKKAAAEAGSAVTPTKGTGVGAPGAAPKTPAAPAAAPKGKADEKK